MYTLGVCKPVRVTIFVFLTPHNPTQARLELLSEAYTGRVRYFDTKLEINRTDMIALY